MLSKTFLILVQGIEAITRQYTVTRFSPYRPGFFYKSLDCVVRFIVAPLEKHCYLCNSHIFSSTIIIIALVI